jgi:hypothetical protein
MKHLKYNCLFFGWLILSPFTFSFLSAQLILNEFMIDPENENTGEYIELYNYSDSTICLTSFFICDEQDTDAILPFPDSLIFANSYALILDPDYLGEYDINIPDSVARLTICDSRFGMYGISNSTQKHFSLLGQNKLALDTYLSGMPVWPDEKYSIERIQWQDSLWSPSHISGGTPGFRNSVSPKNTQISIRDFSVVCSLHTMNIFLKIINIGLLTIPSIECMFFYSATDTRTTISDTLYFNITTAIAPGDSLKIEKSITSALKGQLEFTAILTYGGNIHDTISSPIYIPILDQELQITEFVCKTGAYFTSEYIEILSRCDLPIQLFEVEIADMTGSTKICEPYIIYPDSFIVVAQSTCFYDDFPDISNVLFTSAWRSLNNTEDIICLQNPQGSSICDLHYTVDWDIPPDCAMQLVDTALDPQDPKNWEISYTGSPGRSNQTQNALLHLSCFSERSFYLAFDTLVFFVINDGYFTLPEQVMEFHYGEDMSQITLPASSPDDTICVFPDTSVFNSEGTIHCALHCEPYFTNEIKYFRPYTNAPCLFNEILFDPIDTYGQVEFIEIEKLVPSLDLENWQLQINNRSITLNGILESTYTVLSDDEEPLWSVSNLLTLNNFPTLPNEGADCFLLDPLGQTMDHCDLRDHPDIKTGKSLEKQFQGISSEDPKQWSFSVSHQGMTPGHNNSIRSLPSSRNCLSVFPEIFEPNIDDVIQFSIDSETAIHFLELYCFNMAGQIVFQKEQNLFANPSCLIFWNGQTPSGAFPARGIYLALVILHTIDDDILKLSSSFVMK